MFAMSRKSLLGCEPKGMDVPPLGWESSCASHRGHSADALCDWCQCRSIACICNDYLQPIFLTQKLRSFFSTSCEGPHFEAALHTTACPHDLGQPINQLLGMIRLDVH